ncbi:YrhC family protein [Paraliobacillus sp. JSM ZJ581]|uniref:YrhC family protein n=1 Tax=Paraliobacillus sp. JSM ZJ581 TaxID=3342118 RepID=UPI0035A81DA1
MEQAIRNKIADYSRFTFILLILSAYLYVGMLIQLYMKQTTEHISFIVSLVAVCLIGAWIFTMRISQLNKQNI